MDKREPGMLTPADNSTLPPPKPPRPEPQVPSLCNFFVPGEPKAKGSWQPIILNRKQWVSILCRRLSGSPGKDYGTVMAQLKYLRTVLVPTGSKDVKRAKAQWTKAVEDEVAWAWREQHGSMLPKEAAVEIHLLFHMPRGVSVKRKYPTVAPDGDKLERLVMDAMEGIVYKNDAQVCDVIRRKRYAVDARHGLEVSISLLQ